MTPLNDRSTSTVLCPHAKHRIISPGRASEVKKAKGLALVGHFQGPLQYIENFADHLVSKAFGSSFYR